MGTSWTWNQLRKEVYERDKGICWVCDSPVKWEHYDLGHIVDRCAGGPDHPNNLAVMCNYCNRNLKPLHKTKEEAEHWRAFDNPWDKIAERSAQWFHLQSPEDQSEILAFLDQFDRESA